MGYIIDFFLFLTFRVINYSQQCSNGVGVGLSQIPEKEGTKGLPVLILPLPRQPSRIANGRGWLQRWVHRGPKHLALCPRNEQIGKSQTGIWESSWLAKKCAAHVEGPVYSFNCISSCPVLFLSICTWDSYKHIPYRTEMICVSDTQIVELRQ